MKIAKYTDTFKELILIYLCIIASAALAYSIFEHRTIIDSVWWAMVTAMTVGYGDTYPLTIPGRIIGVMLMHAVPLFLVPLVIARILNTLVEDRNAFTDKEQKKILTDLSSIKKQLKIKK